MASRSSTSLSLLLTADLTSLRRPHELSEFVLALGASKAETHAAHDGRHAAVCKDLSEFVYTEQMTGLSLAAPSFTRSDFGCMMQLVLCNEHRDYDCTWLWNALVKLQSKRSRNDEWRRQAKAGAHRASLLSMRKALDFYESTRAEIEMDRKLLQRYLRELHSDIVSDYRKLQHSQLASAIKISCDVKQCASYRRRESAAVKACVELIGSGKMDTTRLAELCVEFMDVAHCRFVHQVELK